MGRGQTPAKGHQDLGRFTDVEVELWRWRREGGLTGGITHVEVELWRWSREGGRCANWQRDAKILAGITYVGGGDAGWRRRETEEGREEEGEGEPKK